MICRKKKHENPIRIDAAGRGESDLLRRSAGHHRWIGAKLPKSDAESRRNLLEFPHQKPSKPRRTVLFCRNKNPVKIHSSWRFYFPTDFSPSFLGPKSASRCSLLVFAYAGFVGSQQVSNQSPILGDQKTICYRY